MCKCCFIPISPKKVDEVDKQCLCEMKGNQYTLKEIMYRCSQMLILKYYSLVFSWGLFFVFLEF